MDPQQLIELGLAAGGLVVSVLLGVLFVRRARAARQRQIDALDQPEVRQVKGKAARAPIAAEPEPEPESEPEGDDAEPEPAAEVLEDGAPERAAPGAASRPTPAVPRPLPAPLAPAPKPRAPAEPQQKPVAPPADAEPAVPVEKPPKTKKGAALATGLARTKSGWIARLGDVFKGRREIDPTILDEVEKVLLTADIGVRTSQKLLEEMRTSLSRKELADVDAVWAFLRRRAAEILSLDAAPVDWTAGQPFVLLIIGVNGSGKTTTIGKLAAQLVGNGKKVVLGAGDTFRAAATEQLEIWANRVGATLVRGKEGADPSSVLFDAVKRAKGDDAQIVIADTAGRLHTKTDLMEELQKVRRVIGKATDGAPHETWLVIDSTSGQNAIAQAEIFTRAMAVSGIVLTKLDGTAKGGVILGIADQLKIPVRYIGIGERVEDLREFDAEEFVAALFDA